MGRYLKADPELEALRRDPDEEGSWAWARISVHAQVEDLDTRDRVEVLEGAAWTEALEADDMGALMPTFWSDDGKAYRVRLVRRGERYGRDDKLIHDDDDPLVEFYFVTEHPHNWPRGFFVSRYGLATLLERDRRSGLLLLDGGAYGDDYALDRNAMTQVYRWLEWLGASVLG